MAKDRQRSAAEQPAEIVREYGPFPGAQHVGGVSFDGSLVWFAGGEKLHAFEPATGASVRALDVACDAGTAFDGRHLYQIADDRILKIDPATGAILSTIPAPGGGRDSGLTWAEGTLWVGAVSRSKDPPDRSRAPARSCGRSNRTGSSPASPGWTASSGTGPGKATTPTSARSIPQTGEVLTRLTMPAGTEVSGLESDQRDLFYAGGGKSGRVRAVRKPRRR